MISVRKTYKLFIGGQMVRSESGRAFQPTPELNIPQGSRKDIRDAIRAARGAFPGWASKTATNRGQILYRVAEMLDARGREFVELIGDGGAEEVQKAIDCWVWYAGWADKYAQLVGTNNPVAGPYFNFTVPEPMGVVGIICPQGDALLALTQRLAPVVCSGNTAVVVPSETQPEVALDFAEVLATSDVPAGVVNVVAGLVSELLKPIASHMDVNALEISGLTADQRGKAEELSAANVKRAINLGDDTIDTPYAISSFTEFKTIWHPIGQ